MMDIPAINDKYVDNIISNTKKKAADDSFEARLKSVMGEKDKDELKKVCKEFEGIMLNMMYKQMKASVPKSELIPGDAGRDVFESMLDDSLVEESSKNGSFGLAETLYKQLSREMDTKFVAQGKGEEKIDKKK